MAMSEVFSVPFYTLIKLCFTKALEWSSLVPGPEDKFYLEVTNMTSFTISYQESTIFLIKMCFYFPFFKNHVQNFTSPNALRHEYMEGEETPNQTWWGAGTTPHSASQQAGRSMWWTRWNPMGSDIDRIWGHRPGHLRVLQGILIMLHLLFDFKLFFVAFLVTVIYHGLPQENPSLCLTVKLNCLCPANMEITWLPTCEWLQERKD